MKLVAGSDITDLLIAWSAGDQEALGPLMEEVYQRLVRIAAGHLRGERADHTLDAPALVNETFLRLVQQDRVRWQGRSHFFAVTARLMRRVLLDHARRHASIKRGSDVAKVPLEQAEAAAASRPPDLLALDEALRELETRDAELSELVVLRYFGGMCKEEVGEVLGLSSATVSRRWRTARAWLYEYLQGDIDAGRSRAAAVSWGGGG